MERGGKKWREEGSNGERREVMERGERREGEGSNGKRREVMERGGK